LSLFHKFVENKGLLSSTYTWCCLMVEVGFGA